MNKSLILINQHYSADRFHLRLSIQAEQHAVRALSCSCDLSKTTIKKALIAGCIFLKRPGCKTVRIRKANYALRPLDRVDFYYDKDILNAKADDPVLLRDTSDFSIWYKPANIFTQGGKFGDHLALLRFAEKKLNRIYRLHLVHRLDRETFGLVVIAHNKKSAAALSSQFAPPHHAQKRYWARVMGLLQLDNESLKINVPLDGKAAVSIIEAARYDRTTDTTELFIELKTGRFHQIRRHLCGIKHPVCGDYRYGETRGDKAGLLQLCAWQLSFDLPGTTKRVVATLPENLLPFNQAPGLNSDADV